MNSHGAGPESKSYIYYSACFECIYSTSFIFLNIWSKIYIQTVFNQNIHNSLLFLICIDIPVLDLNLGVSLITILKKKPHKDLQKKFNVLEKLKS